MEETIIVDEREEKKSFISWIKEHKKQLIIAGISISALILSVIVAYKNKESIHMIWEDLKKTIKDVPSNIESKKVDVVAHPVTIEDVLEVRKDVSISETKVVECIVAEKKPFEVHKHVRNLAPGWHASPEKIATACENGIELMKNQTWVKDYTKGLEEVA